jgi:spectinomycin phosphotransferase
MLEKPDLPDERLRAAMLAGYGLHAGQPEFLPLGLDINTAVYRCLAGSEPYFLKLRRGPFDELSVALPAHLAGLGLSVVIPPLPTLAAALAFRLEPYTLALYPFVEGVDGYVVDLSQAQWRALGAAVRQLHSAELPAALRAALPRETYTPLYRQRVRAWQARLAGSAFTDPVSAALAELAGAQAARITQLVEAAERLAAGLAGAAPELVLCHADLHNGNLLISPDGAVSIVDWDTAMLAPKEHDLMFVGFGLGRAALAGQQSAWFYQGYGPVEIDRAALAYYRCERIVQDIDAFCGEIVDALAENLDRSRNLAFLASQFEPGGLVDLALERLREVPLAGVGR